MTLDITLVLVYNKDRKRDEDSRKARRYIMRIYFNDDHTKYVISQRVNLNEYHEPEARELYDWIEEETDKKDQWDAVPWEAYDHLCDLCGVDEDECEDTQDLMDKCLAEIEKEEAEAKKK